MNPATPWIEYVPKTVKENLAWRLRMREAALHDVHLQHALYDAAMEDLLFYTNAFCWLLEPRAKHKEIPFITWPHQDPFLLKLDATIDEAQERMTPIVTTVFKSRAQGGTYGYLAPLTRRFLRDRRFSAGLVTRNEALVDSETDDKALLWKVWWSLQMHPFWMLPKGFNKRDHRSLSDHTIINPDNGSIFTGYAATADVARGGRTTVFVPDEFGSEEFIQGGKDYKVLSSISSVTNCIWLVSTIASEQGAFAAEALDPDNPNKIILDWKDNPEQTKLAYTVHDGKPTAVRPEEQAAVERYFAEQAKNLKRIQRRGHKLEDKFRSPFYDAQCLILTPRLVAREYDMDPRGAASTIFSSEVLDEMVKECCRPPIHRGKMVFDQDECQPGGWLDMEGGEFKLWFPLGMDKRPMPGLYVVGCDVAGGTAGTQSSNSSAVVTNRITREQVAEFASPRWSPGRFARLSVALCRWFHNAYLIWESNGPTGSMFTQELLKLGYANIHYHEKSEIEGVRKTTRVPGFHMRNDEHKGQVLESLCLGMEDGRFIPRSERMVEECRQYQWKGNEIIFARSERNKDDGDGTRTHGDRAIAAGLCFRGIETLGVVEPSAEETPVGDVPYLSMAWWEQYDQAHAPGKDEGWGDEESLDNSGNRGLMSARGDGWR